MKRALIFVSRCQNLESPANTTQFAAKIGDGGFYYTPAGAGSSPAGRSDNGGLRSYGSMSYAGLKSMIFAGLKEDDPRVKAAVQWARDHYTLSENPGLGDEGLYYYYHLFGKAIAALGQEKLVDSQGAAHDRCAPTWLPSSAAASGQMDRGRTPTWPGWKGTRTW